MPQQVRGVVARSKGAPVTVETIVVPDPGPGEAVVKVQACGVCHTDLHYREGGINDEFPFLLGHEAAGVVEAVGDGRHRRRAGRLRHPQLARGRRHLPRLPPRPALVLLLHAQRGAEDDARVRRRSSRPRSASARSSRRRSCTPGSARRSTPRRKPEVAGLLGCGVMAGLGAAINTGGVGRGDSIAVIGCGGVGDAAIAGARLAGAATIIAVDTDDRKLEWAKEFGATHTVNARERDVVEAVQELTDGNGADVVIDAVGRPETFKQAFYARDLAGTVVLVGVPTPDMTIDLPLIDVFGRGGAIKSSWYGDCLPSRDFPMLIDLLPAGPPAAGQVRVRDDPARRRRGRVREDAQGRGAAFGRGLLMGDRAPRHVRHVLARRRHVGRRQQRVDRRRRRAR